MTSTEGDRAGEVFAGRFRFVRRLGTGGMGDVWLASQEGFGRKVAIKILRNKGTAAARARFRREASIAARLASERVVRVTDFDDAGAEPYLVMEYVDGPTLAQEIARRGTFAVADAVDRALDVCEALAEAHREGIVHRDVKPANLLVARATDGALFVKVGDFGVARADGDGTLTGDGAALGSPSYMAPEQIDDPHGVDARTDLFAVGVLLFEMLTGVRPFEGPTVSATLMRVTAGVVPRLQDLRADVPAGLGDAVARCLEKRREARFPSAAELARSIAPFGSVSAAAAAERVARVAAGFAPPPGQETLDPDREQTTTVDGGTITQEASPAPVTSRRPGARAVMLGALGTVAVGLIVLVGRRTPSAASPSSSPSSTVSVAAGSPSTEEAPATAPPATSDPADRGPAAPMIDTQRLAPPPRRRATADVVPVASTSTRPIAPPPASTPPPPPPGTELDGLGPRK